MVYSTRKLLFAFPPFPIPDHAQFPSDPFWRDSARCSLLGLPLKMFIGGQGSYESAGRAKKICQECAVRMECLVDGMNSPVGVWGGTSYEDRKVVKKLIGKGWRIEEAIAWVDEGAKREKVRDILLLRRAPRNVDGPVDGDPCDDDGGSEPTEMDLTGCEAAAEQEPA